MKKVWLASTAMLLAFAASDANALQPALTCEQQGGRVTTLAVRGAINGHGISASYIEIHFPGALRVPICHFPGHRNPQGGGDFLVGQD